MVPGKILEVDFLPSLKSENSPRIADVGAVDPIQDNEDQDAGAPAHRRIKLETFPDLPLQIFEQAFESSRKFGVDGLSILQNLLENFW